MNLPDMQSNPPKINIPIERVGINNLIIPIYISEKSGGQQHTVASVDVYVDLDSNSKGTHMSRLAIGVQKFLSYKLDSSILKQISEHIRLQCKAEKAEIKYRFPYFINKMAPTTNEPGLVHYNVEFTTITGINDFHEFKICIEIVGTSLCPCSKEISENGAHNQRSKVLVTCVPEEFIWIEDIIDIVNKSMSCEIYSVLKRPDEKFVTEKAYNNPGFVEDIVRQSYLELQNNFKFKQLMVEVKNEESIHLHDAYARIGTIK